MPSQILSSAVLLALLSVTSGRKLTVSQVQAEMLQSQYTQPLNQVYDSSLASCQKFALLFSNTCDPTLPAVPYDSVPTVDKTCYNVGYCPSATIAGGVNTGTGACTFTRKQCVTCTTNSTDGLTYIRMQSNLMPDYCYHSGSYPPLYTWVIDYQVPFNQNISKPLWNLGTVDSPLWNAANNISQFEALTCSKNYTMERWITKLTNLGTDPIPGPGIVLTGSLMAPGLSGDGYDAFNTTVYGPMASQAQVDAQLPTQFDRCMTHVDGNGFLHNHLLPGCSNAGDPVYAATQGHACDLTDACHSDPIGTGMNNFHSAKGLQPTGLTTDGHIVWGPYKANGNTWSACDVDACNGVYVGGYYGYVNTNFFPYGPQCFGGATQFKGKAAPCSLSSKYCPSS